MKFTTYDSMVLQQYADQLYAEARWIVLTTAVTYAFIGAGLVFVIALVTKTVPQAWSPTLVAFSAIGGLIGIAVGRKRGFRLKLEAQKVLCQRAIERNTRQATEALEAEVSR